MKAVPIYTNTDCDSCHETKAFLDENNIPYIESDISKEGHTSLIQALNRKSTI